MLAEIAAGLSSLKAATDIVKGLNAANTQAAINDVKLALQANIFEAREALAAAQETQTAALQRIRELEQQIMQLKNWEREKERYHLTEVKSGRLAYAPKPDMQGGEPNHYLCANCFDRGEKSHLQRTLAAKGGHVLMLSCPRCKFELDITHTM
jgi:hypothetical protein